MLAQLFIKNVAVISEAVIDFERGLNVFTGETGAGKSILVGAINAVLGERASKDMIRTGETKAEISALFTDLRDAAKEALEQAGYPAEEDDSVLIYREIGTDGKSSCKINGRPATLSILKSVSALLINIHGQHDNQQLLSPQKHLDFIDRFGEQEALRELYHASYSAYQRTKKELEKLSTDDSEKARRMDLLRYQIEEIEAARLSLGEEEELTAQSRLLKNALNVTQALGESVALLDGDEDAQGLMTSFDLLKDQMAEAAKYMEDAQQVSERLTDLFYELEGYSSDIHRLLENFDCDASQLDSIESRLDELYKLKKKYGPDVSSILAFYDHACEELEQIETSDVRAETLRNQEQKLLEETRAHGKKLSAARKKAAAAFTAAVQKELAFLDMPFVRLAVRQEGKEISPDGMDEVELLIAANVGEAEKSLSKIASGGELSRIMLSILNVMAGRDEVQTMIFDEVDTGVSGRAAQKIGQKLAQVSENRQVIVVTHLAQVASYAMRHLLISKEAKGDRTFTTIQVLERDSRIRELARITAGSNISELALRHAEEMLRDAGNG